MAFSLLIIVHELGHFVTAKKSGVRVNEFWLGMGPVLFQKKFGETNYTLRLFPIGGAVVMEGEDGESNVPDSFGKAKIANRMLIITAGAIMNLLVGFLIVCILVMPTKQMATNKIERFANGFSSEGESMLMVGDEILKVDGYSVWMNNDIMIGLSRASDTNYDILVRRNGENVLLKDVPLKPKHFEGDPEGTTRYGFYFQVKNTTLKDNLLNSFYTSANFARMVWLGLSDLMTGKVGMDQLSGPVGITGVLANTAKENIRGFWLLVAFISINLGVMNLLPLPALDGGRLMFLLIELIIGHKVNPKYEGYVHGAGLALLMLLMLYVTFHDVFRLLTPAVK